MVTKPRNTLSDPPSQYSTTSSCAVNPLSTKARRFSRIATRPCQSLTPRLAIASGVKQSKPFPQVLSSISLQNASNQAGGAVFVNVCEVIDVSVCVGLSERAVARSRNDSAVAVVAAPTSNCRRFKLNGSIGPPGKRVSKESRRETRCAQLSDCKMGGNYVRGNKRSCPTPWGRPNN